MKHAMAVDRELCLRCGFTAQKLTEQHAFECEPLKSTAVRLNRHPIATTHDGKLVCALCDATFSQMIDACCDEVRDG